MRTSWPAVLGIVVACALTGCSSANPPHRARTSPHTGRPAATAPLPGRRVARAYLVGANGRWAWQVTRKGLLLTANAARTWSSVPLPAGVAPRSVTAVATKGDHTVWLAVAHHRAVDLYHLRRAGDRWRLRTLTPRHPNVAIEDSSFSASIALGQNGLVDVVAGWALSTTESYNVMFESTRGGGSFAQHATGIGYYVSAITVENASTAVLVAGPIRQDLYGTSDGGKSWTLNHDVYRSDPGHAYRSAGLGAPLATGDQLEIPEVTQGVHRQTLTLSTSVDQGRTFTRLGAPLRIPIARSSGDVFPGVLGATIWMPAHGRVYQSNDSGAHWSFVTPNMSPIAISLVNKSIAIGTGSGTQCPSDAQQCLLKTIDGGRIWNAI